MALNFKIWLEERTGERFIKKVFLKRLGYNPTAIDDVNVGSITLDSQKDKILSALDSMGLTEESVEKLKNWVMSNPQSTLQDLMNQIRPIDLMAGQKQKPDQKTPELPGQNAQLPPGDNSPRPVPAGQPGVPPTQGRMQVPF